MRRLILAALPWLAGCPEPEPAQGCPTQGEPALQVFRRDGEPLPAGARLDVFYAPQGGIFTELDLVATGLSEPDIVQLSLQVLDEGSGEVLAQASYAGDVLPWLCTTDPSLVMQNVPLGFSDGVELEALDGRAVALQVRLEHDRSEQVVVYEQPLELEASSF